jgi:hypothetical protein
MARCRALACRTRPWQQVCGADHQIDGEEQKDQAASNLKGM